MARCRTRHTRDGCTGRPPRIVEPGLAFLAATALMFCFLLSLSAQYAEAQGPVDCPMTIDAFAEDAVDAIPLSPGCAETRLSSTLMMYPGSFLRQHAICPDATVQATPTGAPQPFVLSFASAADASGADKTKGTAYVVLGNNTTRRGITAYTVASQVVTSPVPSALNVTLFLSFSVNTSDFNTPIMLSDAAKGATIVWNYDADQKTGLILNVNVAIFAPGPGTAASAVETAARKATMKGKCVEAFGPSNFTKTASGVEYFGLEDFATGRLQIFAQMQKGNCSVDSVVFLNPDPMKTGCGIPPPPPPPLSRRLFLECGLELGLPYIIDALRDLLQNSANQTVPNKAGIIAASNDAAPSNVDSSSTTVQRLGQRGAALISAAVAAVQDVKGSFQYDGANAWAVNLDIGLGDVPGPTNLTIFQLLKRILNGCSPFLSVKLNKGSITNPIASASFSYSSQTQLVDISFTTKQALWLLSSAAKDVGQLVGFNVPDPPVAGADRSTLTTRMVTDRVNGLRLLSIGLDGNLTVGSLAKRIGLQWGFADNAVIISSPSILLVAPPSFQMEDGTVLPSSLRVNLLLSVPGIALQNAVAGLVIQSSSNFFFTVYGTCAPIPDWPDFSVTGFAFTMTNNSGITATFSTELYKASIQATLNFNRKVLTASIVASNVAVVEIIKGIFSDVNIPGVILDLIRPVKFSTVSITAVYNTTKATKKLSFQFLAVPNFEATSDFAKAISSLGLSPKDVALSLKPDPSTGDNVLEFGVTKSVYVTLPSPFIGKGVCKFSVQAISTPAAVRIYGKFTAALNLKGANTPLNFSIGAGILVGPGQPQLLLDAALISPFFITKFPWLGLNSLSLSAAIEMNPYAPILRKLVMTGSQLILGATATQVISYNTNAAPPVFAWQNTIESFDLQNALNQMGIDVNLQAFNLLVRSAGFSFANEDVTVDGIFIPAGVKVGGSISLFSILDADIGLLLQPTGTSFNVAINTTVLNKVFATYLIAPVAETLRAGSAAFQAASNAVGSTAATARASLEKAKADVQTAKDDANTKLNVFLAYQKEVSDAFAAAQAKVNSALDAFNAAKQKADSEFQTAQARVDTANAEFEKARTKAYAAFTKAQADVASAQKAFDDFRNAKKADLDAAQAKVNDLQAKVDCFNDKSCSCTRLCAFGKCCCRVCYSCCPQNVWAPPALAVAKGVLSAAWDVFNAVLKGTQAAALATAQAVLKGAQAGVDGLLQGSEWAAVNTAKAALEAARVASQAVLSGSEAAARDSANAVLEGAQIAVQNILKSTQYVASAAANATFDTAKATLSSAQKVVDAAEATIRFTLDVISTALERVTDPSFFVMNGFSVGFSITKTTRAVNASISVVISGSPYRPILNLDLNNPLGIIKDAVKTEAIKILKALFPAISSAL